MEQIFFFSPMSSEWKERGLLLAASLHQLQGRSESHLRMHRDFDVGKNVLRDHRFHCTKDEKIFQGLLADQVYHSASTDQDTCCEAWPGEWSNLFYFISSEKSLEVLC